MSRLLVLTTVAALVFAGLAVGKDDDPVVTLCAKKKGGAVRLDGDGKCKRTESRIRVNQRGVPGAQGAPGATGLSGAPGAAGPTGPAGADATPADFAGEPTTAVTVAPSGANQCTTPGQFCTGGNNWKWRNFGNGYQAVGFWK